MRTKTLTELAVLETIRSDSVFAPPSLTLENPWLISTESRATLKGTNPRGRTPICGFLRAPAVSCENQRFSTKICASHMHALPSRKRRESAKISENLRLGSVCPLKRALTIGSGCGTVGKCTGPKWSKMVRTTILVKMTLFRTDFSIRETKMDHFGPFWSILA